MPSCAGLALAGNEVQLSMLQRKIERNGVLDTAHHLGVTLIAYMPLKSGILTGKFHDDPGRVALLPRTRQLIDELRAVARAYGATPWQVALASLVQFYGDKVVAIHGASQPHQAEEAAGDLRLSLTDKELARLDEVSRAYGG